MADRPILFSGPMVRALLDGRKTQTRRVLKSIEHTQGDEYHIWGNGGGVVGVHEIDVPKTAMDYVNYETGDRLYVREAWRTFDGAGMWDDLPPRELSPQIVWYEADGKAPEDIFPGKFRQAMHMPRWASRLTLIVTDVRVQRLQEISQDDAIAEGPGFIAKITGEVCESVAAHRLGIGPRWRTPRDWYADLWDSLNADRGYGWDANPWVVAVSFTVEHANIDASRALAGEP